MDWSSVLYEVLTKGLLIYSICIVSGYIAIGIYSILENIRHMRKHSFTDYNIASGSEFVPSLSILAPAYNESATIVENVRSLLSIYYNNLELIIINDGSKDDSLQKLIGAYDLERVPWYFHEQIPTRPVKGIYKSRNPVFSKLLVVDKENGGKADALNVGLNVATGRLVTCLDVDCVLEQDALLRMVKPFMEDTGKRVIATGGVVRIANSCVVENGKITRVRVPDNYLARIQSLEYLRAFILGRMAWTRLNGLLIISGAFGMFDREIAIKAGGYSTKTVGEDMELVVRMRIYMEEHKTPYAVRYISDPLCWTEVPSTYKILGRQRNRWTRGTIETLYTHRKLFFNPRYKVLGMLSYPYWFFFEFLAPILEFTGMFLFILLALAGVIDWSSFFMLLAFIWAFGLLFSSFAILMEILTFHQYKEKGSMPKLLSAALLEPLIFHPFIVWSAIKGNLNLLLRTNTGWGVMTRKGFTQAGNATGK